MTASKRQVTHDDMAIQKDDKTIQRAVEEELDWTPDVNATHIGVSVDGGRVTLSGAVDSIAERTAATKAAYRVDGVTGVEDDIAVRRDPASNADIDIQHSVDRILEWTSGVPSTVTAKVHDRKVVLTGQADWNYQRVAAAKAAGRVLGVVSVDNQVTLQRRPSAGDTAERIKNAFVWNATLDANTITVTVSGNTVTLTGSVHSWAEKKQAVLTAWSSPNVAEVIDDIIVL
ncbi:BON domain-containing protein [Mycetocola miduiensis]|uniref:Osmotically-inducible protein OsmY, contains BON domain n=1 Tax=Mycetocola miduiensis TaxID=995034 RepID=A0A1I4ZY52_9MICO|nr:BON domain-containing protein [Mycetocola miduiensis]SFN55111.1 Osmotically-inducible protein OsmY, contains BON domain [Mycetocola miduiensis]